MRWMLSILLLIAAMEARADARLKLSADRAVVIVVNMVPHPLSGASYEEVVIDIADGKEGLQNIRVLNALGKEQWKGTILVKRGQMVRARWQGRTFEVYDRKNLDTRFSTGRKAPKPVAGHKELDQLASASVPDRDDDVLAAIADAHAAQSAEPEPVEITEEPMDESTPVSTKGGRLELVNRTSSWANAWVDGALVHEFRGESDSFILTLEPGEYSVQFRDFQDREDWGHGTITVYGDIVVQLHFSKAEKPEAINRKEAWVQAD